jgi:DNA modification methylase
MNKIFNVNCIDGLKTLDAGSVNTCVTSPPYFGLRDYGVDGQIGREPTPQDFVDALVAVFREVKRTLRDDGTLWVNLGDCYIAGDLAGVPWQTAFALKADGWVLRSEIIWAKPNPMPESVKNRPSKSHEHIFLMSKSPRYHCDMSLVREPQAAISIRRAFSRNNVADRKDALGGECAISGAAQDKNYAKMRESIARGEAQLRNKCDVWRVPTAFCREAHFATFPPELIRPCVLAGAPAGGLVLDPFMGAGTTAMVSKQEGRKYIGFELNPEYIKIAERRIASVAHPLEGLI